ncbi:recombinase family protein [Pseudoalteromonas fenneropenaei]|uniref:Recombinase family protein n=1 Tax=Pseudoalteromonas fenneropenaei TaxID=1737459 RepID=A0ABV7CLU0_9GAMM
MMQIREEAYQVFNVCVMSSHVRKVYFWTGLHLGFIAVSKMLLYNFGHCCIIISRVYDTTEVIMSNGQRLAYIRCSTVEQNTDRQLIGLEFDEVFIDKCSGSSAERPALKQLKSHSRKGDSLYCHSIDRLARNLVDLLQLIKWFTSKGIDVHFVSEGLSFTGEANPFQELQLQILGSCAQFERSMILARQKEGIAARKAKGLPVGRKSVVDEVMRQGIIQADRDGVSKSEIAKTFGIGRATVYRVLQ